MSLAGSISFTTAAPAEVLASLGRLALPGIRDAAVLERRGAALGVVNGSQAWAESPKADSLLAIFDGDLYDRAQLARTLEAGGAGASDAELVGLAYRRWGEEFPNRVDGEFAFAVWDPTNRRLVLGRDAMGRGALHYGSTADAFLFASEPRGLRHWPGLDYRVDEGQIARLLSLQIDLGRTLFRGIRYVPGGHVLVIEPGRPQRLVRYWQPHRQPRMQVKDGREYAEALRAAMQRAVEIRLPSSGLVGSHLSSGFDSSGVTALAAQALARQGRQLVSYTSVPAHPADAKKILKNRFADEWPLAHAVAAMYPNVEHVPIRTDAAGWWEALDTMADAWEAPASFIRNAPWFYAIHKDAQQRGIGVMLEAKNGNLTASYDGSFGLFDIRRSGGGLLELARAVRLRRKMGQKWRPLAQAVWMPSARAVQRVQRLYGKRPKGFYELSLMRPEFYASTGLPPIVSSAMGATLPGDRTSGAAWRLSLLQLGDFGMDGAGMKRYFGIKLLDPTADRQLVELCLRIPDEAFCAGGRKRNLYRQAMRNDLPEDLLNEPLRGLQSSDFLELFGESIEEFRAEVDRLKKSPTVGKYLDLKRMEGMLDSWPGERFGDKSAVDLAYNYTFGGALAMGRFLRRLEAQTYLISGLLVSSEIVLPSASPCAEPDRAPDVFIHHASVPEHLPAASSSGEDWETDGDSFLIRAAGVGGFVIRNGASIAVDPESECDPGELALYTLGTCFATLLQQRGAIVLHASAISVGSKAVLFCGPSGAGKSTIAAMLCQYGYPMLNDDVCTIVHTEEDGYNVLSDTRKLKLWGASLEGLSLNDGNRPRVSGRTDKYFVAPALSQSRKAEPIGAIYLLDDAEPSEPVTITRLDPLEATVQLKLNAYRPILVKALHQQEAYFHASLAFQRAAGVFRLRRARDFRKSEELIAVLQRHWKDLGLHDSAAAGSEIQLSEATAV